MSRKHFEAMANSLANLRPDCSPNTVKYKTWLVTVKSMADICGQFNNAFDRERFAHACETR